MAQNLSVLFVSSEVAPYIRTGDLAETSSLLSLAVREHGHDVRITFPKYGFMSERRNRIHEITRLREFGVPIAGVKDIASCKSSSLNNTRAKVQVYVIGNQTYFGRLGINADPTTHKEYPDNGLRYAFFSRSILETCKLLGWRPQIIHCLDWQSALIPAYAKLLYANDGFFANTKFVFTPVGLGYQGVYDKKVFEAAGYPAESWNEDGVASHGKINFIKAGVNYADLVSIGSVDGAERYQNKDGGDGLHLAFAAKKKKKQMIGITHGIDYDIWDPMRDKHLEKKYGAASAADRIENKRAFCERVGFEFSADVPMIAIPGPLTAPHGGELLLQILPDLLKHHVQVVVYATGDPKLVDAMVKIGKKASDKMAVHTTPSEDFLHQLYAASDFVLAAGEQEPVGTSHQIGMRYGALPIAVAAGTAADLVLDPSTGKTQSGTGFRVAKASATEFAKSIKKALGVWGDHTTLHKMVANAMNRDQSWKTAAGHYAVQYKAALKKD
jgi:starch synthase